MSPEVLALISEMPQSLQTILLLALTFGGYKGGARGIQAIQARRNGKNGNGSANTKLAVEALGDRLIPIMERQTDLMESVRDTVRDQREESKRLADIQLSNSQKLNHITELLVEVKTIASRN